MLPGRTDNEIKNYWNAREKRRQRAGSPIYPENISQSYDQPQPQPPQLQLQQQQPPPRMPNSFSPSFSALLSPSSSSPPPSPSYSSLLSSSAPYSYYSNTKLNSPLSFPNPYSFSRMAPTNPLQPTQPYSFLSNPNPQFNHFRDNNRQINGNFLLPFSLPSPSPSTSRMYERTFQGELLPTYPQSLQLNSGNGVDMMSSPPPPSTTTMAALFNPHEFVPPGTEIDLSLLQSPVPGLGLGTTTTPAYSGSTVRGGGGDGDGMIETTPSTEYTIGLIPNPQAVNSGLLDALLDEYKALAQNEISSAEAARKGKRICASEDAAEVVYDSSSGYSSIGMKKNDPREELFDEDYDLSSLPNNFPMTEPHIDWYNAIGTGSFGLNNLPEASPSAVANTTETTNPGQARSSCCWKNVHDKF